MWHGGAMTTGPPGASCFQLAVALPPEREAGGLKQSPNPPKCRASGPARYDGRYGSASSTINFPSRSKHLPCAEGRRALA